MRICVWNIGSTALKFELIELTDQSLRAQGGLKPFERILAKGKIRRVGSPAAFVSFSSAVPDAPSRESRTNRAQTIEAGVNLLLERLFESETLTGFDGIDACAFKTVHLQGANETEGTTRLTPDVLERMAAYNTVAPAHNPPYLAVISACQKYLPNVPMVGAFEFAFHQTMPPRAYLYSVPRQWCQEWGIRRYGFHGASHQYIAERVAELYPERKDLKLVNAHLGGSSSLCAIRDGKSIDTSMGFSPQEGIPNATRCGDFDLFAGLWLVERNLLTIEALREQLCQNGGLAGLSGIAGGSLPKIRPEAAKGRTDCQETLEALTYAICKTVGAYAVALEGLEVLVFTGGLGQHEPALRRWVCDGLAFLGVKLDPSQNNQRRIGEHRISSDESPVAVWVIETHEEIVVARRALRLLRDS